MTLSQLVAQQKKIAPDQLSKLISVADSAPFSPDPLEVDEPLWGSFWQFDVLAAGSTLPAAELALLRAIRLDQSWPADTTPVQFLADLHAAITHPQAGIWTTVIANQPCAVFVSPSNVQTYDATVVWYCAPTERLHAGYHTLFDSLHFAKMTVQRAPGFNLDAIVSPPPTWLTDSLARRDDEETPSLAARLDVEILRHRAKYLLKKR